LVIGLFAGGNFSTATVTLIIACMAAFLIRQPITMIVKAASGRRSRQDLPAALFWTGIYGLLGLAAALRLLVEGYGYLITLAIPGVLVFIWHLALVSRRAERRQQGVEVVACGVLALAAPAAYWVGVGSPQPMGWWLFLLTWFQSAASIVYAYLRLQQPGLPALPDLADRLRMGRRALLYTSFNLIVVIILSFLRILPPLLFIPYALQWVETIWGATHPAIGVKPTGIGLRQLAVSTLFTILFILTWNIDPA
jgi:hypothetical protein